LEEEITTFKKFVKEIRVALEIITIMFKVHKQDSKKFPYWSSSLVEEKGYSIP